MDENNPYWFARKRYGWGWGLPLRWEGWAVLAAYAIGMTLLGIFVSPAKSMIWFLYGVFVLTGALIWICAAKGEPPGGWHWGD